MSSLPSAYLTRLGPIVHRDGTSSALYLALGADGGRLATVTASPVDDAAALRELVAKLPTNAACCALDLAHVGGQLGLELGDLPPALHRQRALAAFLSSGGDYLRASLEAAREVCVAGAEYGRAEPWTKLAILRRFKAKATLRTGKTRRALKLLVQVHAGNRPEGPQLQLEDDGGDARSLPLRLQVTLGFDPTWAADCFEDAFSERFAPRIACMLDGALAVADDSHALLLAAAMRAAVAHMTGAGRVGRASAGLMHCDVEVNFARPLPLAPLPSGVDRLERRTVARLMGQSLVARVPLPHYDDYVCVVIDQRDPQAETFLRHLDDAAAVLGDSQSKGFEKAYEAAVAAKGFFGRWMLTATMEEMLAHNLPESCGECLRAALPPFALRAMNLGSHECDAFFVDFDPRNAKLYGEELRAAERHQETHPEEADEETSLEGSAAIAGTWRDPRGYLRDPLPEDWSVGELQENGALAIAAGSIAALLLAARDRGRRWVNVYFREHPEGRPVSRDEARSVLGKLVGCGRFNEMQLIASDAERVPLAGSRLFAAALKAARPTSKLAARQSESEQAELIERTKERLGEVVFRAREEKRPLRDYCVIIEARRPASRPDGVVATREILEKIFATPASDPFDLRGRFEEPRPAEECVVFVKYPDGIEEIHVSLESVERIPEAEA